MVYCGKPSRACHACRERKTRCDTKVNGCTQCERSKRVCPGYRAQVDLIFWDQSQSVIRKAKARETRRSTRKCLRISQPSTAEEGVVDRTEDTTSPRQDRTLGHFPSLSIPLEDRAMCYFAYNCFLNLTFPGYGGHDELALLYLCNNPDANLIASVKAASLASYAHHVRSSELAYASQCQYMNAIQLTNAALGTPEDAVKDSTLLSVILLGLYEILTGRSQRSMKSWAEHVAGAGTLIKLRGESQLRTPLGRRIFIQATSNMLTSCVQRSMRLPGHVIELSKSLAEFVGDMEFGFRVYLAMLEYNEFWCDIKDGTISNPNAILMRGKEIDEPLAVAKQNCPPEWQFKVYAQKDLDPDIAINGQYHVYSNTFIAGVWNCIRIFRILIHQRIRDVLLQGFASKPPTFSLPEHTSQFQLSTDICYEMQADILATVPQHFGYVKRTGLWNVAGDKPRVDECEIASSTLGHALSDGNSATTVQSAGRACNGRNSTSGFPWHELVEDEPVQTHFITDSPSSPSSVGYLLLWPLWFAGFMDLATKDVQAYCIKNLDKIGQDMGIQQALVLAKVIETNTEPKVWSQCV